MTMTPDNIQHVLIFILSVLFCPMKVSWGTMRVTGPDSSSKLIDFLTSNFGGMVPDSVPLRAVRAVPNDACTELDLSQMSSHFKPGYAVIVDRGRCPFGTKALNAQTAGASLVIMVDRDDSALQRPGSIHPIAGYISIPMIMIPWDGANYLFTQLDKSRIKEEDSCAEGEKSSSGSCADTSDEFGSISFDVVSADDASLSNDWIDVALTEFAAAPDDIRHQIEGLIEKHSGKHDIVAWLRRYI
jgi:hypothetical protein